MVTSYRTFLLKVSAAYAIFSYSSCKKDGPSRTDLLVGKWELEEFDGSSANNEISFEFEDDGDFEICFQESGTSYCYDGEWEWANGDEDEIEMEYTDSFGDSYDLEFEVDVLNDEELSGELESDGYTYDVVFERD